MWRPVFWALIARFGTVCSKANTVSGNGASHAFASFDVVWSGSHGASFPVHFRSRPSITLDRGRRVTARAARGRTLPSRRRTLTRRVSGASCASPPRVSCSRRSASSDQPSRGELAGPVCASPREWSSAPFSVVGSGPHGRVFWCISGRLRTSPRVSSFPSFGVVGSGPCEASLSVHFRSSPLVSARHRACRRSRRSVSSDRALTRRVLRCISGRSCASRACVASSTAMAVGTTTRM